MTSAPTPQTPSKVTGVHVTSGVQNNSPILTVAWLALAEGAVTYIVQYCTSCNQLKGPQRCKESVVTPPISGLENWFRRR